MKANVKKALAIYITIDVVLSLVELSAVTGYLTKAAVDKGISPKQCLKEYVGLEIKYLKAVFSQDSDKIMAAVQDSSDFAERYLDRESELLLRAIEDDNSKINRMSNTVLRAYDKAGSICKKIFSKVA